MGFPAERGGGPVGFGRGRVDELASGSALSEALLPFLFQSCGGPRFEFCAGGFIGAAIVLPFGGVLPMFLFPGWNWLIGGPCAGLGIPPNPPKTGPIGLFHPLSPPGLLSREWG